ncbi:MAG: hypothetical protein WC905_03110, partial [Patescibacteria group bacterium]
MPFQFPKLDKYSFPKDILDNRDWYEKSWSGVLFPLYIIGAGCVYLCNKRFKKAFRIGIVIIKNDRMSWLWDMRDGRRIRARFIKLARNNPATIRKYLLAWRRDWQKFKKNINRLDKVDFSRLSDKELYQEYLEFRNNYIWESSLPYLADSFLTTGDKDWLAELISEELVGKISGRKITDYLAILTSPTTNSFSAQEEIDLLRIAADFQANHDRTELTKKLSSHADKYYWVENSYYPTEPLTVEYFKEKVIKIIKAGNVRKKFLDAYYRASKNKKAKERIFKQLRISPSLRRVIRISEVFTAWQDTRKSGVFMANHFIFKILREIGHRSGLKPFEMYYAIDSELADILFKKKFDRRRLQARRRKGCVFINSEKGTFLIEGVAAARYPKERFLGVNRDVREIRGVVASPGLVRGLVRVILDLADFKKFKPGEILVTNNTTPDFVPIMKKAAAII